MITINLLPVREERRKAELRGHVGLVVVLVVLALVLIGIQHSALQREISMNRRQATTLEKEQGKYEMQLKEVAAFKGKKKKIKSKLDVIKQLNANRSGPVRVLDEIATRTPENVFLKGVSTKNGRIVLKGIGLNNEVVASYLSALDASEFFTEVKLETIKRSNSDGLKVSTFEIKALLVAPELNQAAKAKPDTNNKKSISKLSRPGASDAVAG